MQDKYLNFEELTRQEELNKDFKIECIDRNSPVTVIAIHGGRIEPYTTEIGAAIAQQKHSFYSFIGTKGSNNKDLHITSSHFDEPICCNLVAKSDRVISVHGMSGEDAFVMVGGLDNDLIEKVESSFMAASFNTLPADEHVKGNSQENICNKCLSKKGLQLEISLQLREMLIQDHKRMADFCASVHLDR